MIFSDVDIAGAIGAGRIEINPFDRRLLKRNSYLLRLDQAFRRIESGPVIDTAVADDYRHVGGREEDGPSIVVDGDSLVLGCSFERIGIGPDIVGVLSGISNVARLGVMVHCTSQLINAGFSHSAPGKVVFEMATMGRTRVRLYAGTPVCHLMFARLETPTAYPAESRRSAQGGPDASTLLSQFSAFFAQPAPEQVR